MNCFSKYLLWVFAVTLASCSTQATKTGQAQTGLSPHRHIHAEFTPYDASSDARSEVDEALAASKADGKMTVIAMGANWCHDSRAFAAQFSKPRFKPLLTNHFRTVYIDVGKKDRNIDIARRFGLESIAGTPTVFIISPEGEVLNLETAPTWRNAHSRSEDEIYDYFNAFTKNRAAFSGTVSD